MTALLTVVAIWVGALAAVATPVVYATGNRWWTNYWGRTLMAKDVVIGLAYARSVVNLIVGHSLLVNPSWTTAVTTLVMAVALVANLAVMLRVTLRGTVAPPAPEPAEKDPVA